MLIFISVNPYIFFKNFSFFWTNIDYSS